MNYLYQITNLINNKIYIGVHKTDNIDDGYMGSGKVIKSALAKYGIENFKKDVLELFDTYEAALLKEAEIVTDEFLLRPDVYNLRRGGFGGFDYINKSGLASIGRINGYANRTAASFDKMREGGRKGAAQLELSGNRSNGKGFSENAIRSRSSNEAILKKKETYSIIHHQQGICNSQYGTCWITKDFENKKIKVTELDLYLKDNWIRGRHKGNKMPTLKTYVANGNQVQFTMYRKDTLYYKIVSDNKEVDGFEFPVPISDIGDATFFGNDKAMLFMRYIRKHLETVATETADAV